MRLTRYNTLILPFFFTMDILILGLIYVACFELTHDGVSIWDNKYYLQLLAFSGLCWMLASLLFKTYMVQRVRSTTSAVRKMVQAFLFFAAIYFGYNFMTAEFKSSGIFHILFLSALLIIMIFTTIFRHQLIIKYRSMGGNFVPCIIITPEAVPDNISEYFEHDLITLGYRLDHIVRIHNSDDDHTILRSYFKDNHYKAAIIFNPSKIYNLEDILTICDNYGVRSKIIPKYSKSIAQRFNAEMVADFALLDIRNEPLLYMHNKLIKRIVDVIMAILSIIFILTWLPIVTKIFQVLSSPGPLFFKQLRVGVDGKPFIIYKFRTMDYHPKNAHVAYLGKDSLTTKDDERVYWFGKILRKTNLDEYPQFINVLIGQMSVIGPRPHMQYEDESLSRQIPKYPVRRFVKPGISGWAQVHGYRGGTNSLADMIKRTEYDIDYIENWTFWLDIKIIFLTIWQMITFRIPSAY